MVPQQQTSEKPSLYSIYFLKTKPYKSLPCQFLSIFSENLALPAVNFSVFAATTAFYPPIHAEHLRTLSAGFFPFRLPYIRASPAHHFVLLPFSTFNPKRPHPLKGSGRTNQQTKILRPARLSIIKGLSF